MVTIVFKQKNIRRYGDYLQTEKYMCVDMVTIIFKQKNIRRYGNDYLKTEECT